MNKFLIFLFLILSFNHSQARHIDPFDNMPIMQTLPESLRGYAPVEQREKEYRKYLSCSLKIVVEGASGSGTIVYYDSNKNLAYVASCGHLWNEGVMTAAQGKSRKLKCKVITYYHNDIKLDAPKIYPSDVVFYSNVSSLDTSLVTFSPDWTPNYFPIAPLNYEYKIGSFAHSCGCDHGSEVAHYAVKIKSVGNDIVTEKNSPRPGRSGGGLMDESYYIGTCWGTQFVDGSGEGFFTTLSDIHKFWTAQGYQFLLNKQPKKNLGQLIPIKDKNKKEYSPDYILVP